MHACCAGCTRIADGLHCLSGPHTAEKRRADARNDYPIQQNDHQWRDPLGSRSNFDFDLAGVLTYDVAALAEGNSSISRLPAVRPAKPSTSRSNPPPPFIPGADRYKEITQLRYVGFRHLENLRHFRFERITPGAPTQCFEVAANLALFHTLRIAIQEGPALCMRVIAAELESGRKWEDLASCPLTEQHMQDYLAQPARTRHKIA